MKRIQAAGMKFRNEDGHQIILNGINLVCKKKNMGYLEPNTMELLRHYARRGFNLVRLGIFWDGVEPEPGVYDEVYLDKVAEVIHEAEKCGIYILLDMHQDLFATKFADGAPDWAALDEGLPHPEDCAVWYEAYLKSPAVIRAADNFWANKPASDGVGLLDHYEAMWEHIAAKFKGYPNLIGFEPMNEPYMGSIAPQAFGTAVATIMQTNPSFDMTNVKAVTPEESETMKRILTDQFMKFDREVLMPFYNRMLRAIRKSTDIPLTTGGNIYSSSFIQTGIGKIGSPDGQVDMQQVYAPHGYDAIVDLELSDYGEVYNYENVTNLFAQKRASQEELQVPVIVGEWGAFPSGTFTNRLIEHMTRILEKYLWSSTYWVYYQGMENDPNYSGLERGYPVTIAGNLLSYHYDYGKKKLISTWEAERNGKVVLYIPDLSAIRPNNIQVSKQADIVIEPIQGALGGYVTIEAKEEGLVEAIVG
ncbi:glycoside hydrolase family 5 protein [Paenibacillus harenae]|uniref:glycoside hydrolase family 5 protein n=1 Tax=Paenibacillus harenae TaxID=306543 RepID=UPI000414AA03|nr:cellulase family glycosylhydrolase [Paenibacillus harenae]